MPCKSHRPSVFILHFTLYLSCEIEICNEDSKICSQCSLQRLFYISHKGLSVKHDMRMEMLSSYTCIQIDGCIAYCHGYLCIPILVISLRGSFTGIVGDQCNKSMSVNIISRHLPFWALGGTATNSLSITWASHIADIVLSK